MSDETRPTDPSLPPAVPRLSFPAQRIFYLRAQRRLSLSQLAEASGLTERDLHRMETSSPDRVTVAEILCVANGLDANPAWIAYGLGEVGPYPFDPRAVWPDGMAVPKAAVKAETGSDV